MKYLSIILIMGVTLLASSFIPQKYDSRLENKNIFLGSTNFPTSLDTLTNPASTDSVATVSHSSQHSNANDALEALEAKLGIRSSTPVVNTILAGTATGESAWITYATTSSWSSILASTTNLTAFGSTTLQNFTALNSTSTQATTTNFAVSSITTAIPYANASGAFSELGIGSGITLSGGTISASGSTFAFSTTSVQNLSTTTADFSNITSNLKTIEFFFHASTSVPIGIAHTPSFYFNTYSSDNDYTYSVQDIRVADTGAINSTGDDVVNLITSVASGQVTIKGTVTNDDGLWKYGTVTYYEDATVNEAGNLQKITESTFTWKDTSPITSMSFTPYSASAKWATSTTINIFAR